MPSFTRIIHSHVQWLSHCSINLRLKQHPWLNNRYVTHSVDAVLFYDSLFKAFRHCGQSLKLNLLLLWFVKLLKRLSFLDRLPQSIIKLFLLSVFELLQESAYRWNTKEPTRLALSQPKVDSCLHCQSQTIRHAAQSLCKLFNSSLL